jgi:hypothetical protein
MRRLFAWMLLCVGLGVAVCAPPAAAQSAQLSIDPNPTVTQEEKPDAGWSGTLGLTNLTREGLELEVTAAGCQPTLSKGAIGAAQSLEVEITVPSDCQLDADETFGFTVLVTGAKTGSQSLQVDAAVKPAPEKPNWRELRVFPIAVILAFILLGVLIREPPLDPLVHLPSSYSFKESWVANLTIIAGLVTSVFGTVEVVKAFLGPEAERSIALATVGSAIALVLIGCGPIVLLAARRKRPKKPGERVFTVLGLLAAFAVTTGAAFGQLWIGWKAGAELDLDGVEDAVFPSFLVAVALLAWYTVTTLRATIEAGRTEPPPPSSELKEINETLRNALLDEAAVPNPAIPGILDRINDTYPTTSDWPLTTSPSVDLPRRRRAAMP